MSHEECLKIKLIINSHVESTIGWSQVARDRLIAEAKALTDQMLFETEACLQITKRPKKIFKYRF